MNKTLQQIANTIVANLANTESIGLFDGKLGIALFLCRYSRYSGHSIYEDIASGLLDDVFKQLKPTLSPSAIDGIASVGYGLSILLKEHFLESEPDDDVLRDIDETLLNNVRAAFQQERHFPVPLYSSGLYLLSRIPYTDKRTEKAWTSQIVENAISFVIQVRREQYTPKLSLLVSMLFVFLRLFDTTVSDKENINQLLRDILDLSAQAIQINNYRELDVFLLKQIMGNLTTELKTEKQDVIRLIGRTDISLDCSPIEFWYDNLWWGILYNVPVIGNISGDTTEEYIATRMRESYFDETTVNGKLSAVGLWLMSTAG